MPVLRCNKICTARVFFNIYFVAFRISQPYYRLELRSRQLQTSVPVVSTSAESWFTMEKVHSSRQMHQHEKLGFNLTFVTV